MRIIIIVKKRYAQSNGFDCTNLILIINCQLLRESIKNGD